ncbi:hypothetical protein MMC11_005960 [Xylographa trunciseda]|nr:hypothetical protein [Xylographa trunciseda]
MPLLRNSDSTPSSGGSVAKTHQEGQKILYGRGPNLFVILTFDSLPASTYSTPFRNIPAIWNQRFNRLPEAALAVSMRKIGDDQHYPERTDSATMLTAVQSLDAIVERFWQIGDDPLADLRISV